MAATTIARWLAWAGACALPLGCYSGLGDNAPAGADGTDGADDGDGDGDDDDDDDDGDDDDDDLPPGACVEDTAIAATVRRLTNVEYVNTVADTLGVDIAEQAATELPEEVRSDGFSNTSSALLVTYDRVEAYRDLAKSVVSGMTDLSARIDDATSCTDFTEACARPVVEHFGQLLWRRPLTDAEVGQMLPIFDAVAEEGDTFEDAVGLLLEALLQSPQFLYRLEQEWPDSGAPGDVRALDGYELASRLSYLMWGSAPDDALYAAAADGSLTDEDELEAQVRRMLELPRARETSLRYVEDWLALEGLPTINRDPALYPGFSSALAEAMRDETLALADEMLWEEQAPISALLTADFTIVSPELATFYGFANVQADVARYELADTEHRLGMLTHAGVLAINGHGNRPSIVERGLFMLGSVMCRGVAAPPADLDTSMADLEEGQSGRYYSEARLANQTCNNCHGQFDPIAWGFEPFDGVGAFQTSDPDGNALQQDGYFFDDQGNEVPYATVEELVSGVSELDTVVQCIGLRKPLQFAVGRPLGPDDACTLEELGETIDVGNGSYVDLMVAIATHPTFRIIRTEGA